MLNNQLIFGTASVGSRTSYQTFLETASLAISFGINLFDTAPVYGRGIALKYLLRFTNERPDLKINIITKVGRVVKLDLKTLLIYTIRGDFSFLRSGLITRFGPEFELSPVRLVKTQKFHSQLIQKGLISDVLIHSPENYKISTAELDDIRSHFGAPIEIGCSDPKEPIYRSLKTKFGDNFVIQ